jgi:hypothetical protein
MILVKLPLWKAYLYSLMERIRLFRDINTVKYNFGFNAKQMRLLRCMFKKYTGKGGGKLSGRKELRSVHYNELIDSVNRQMVIATQDELEMVNRLSIVKKLNVEDLMKFEISQLKTLAKEVGINALAAAKMKPEELAKEIIKAVDPKKGYSTEFVKWYDAIPDDFLNTIDASGSEEAGGGDNAELIEAINSCTKMGELKEILSDKEIGAVFAKFDASKHKLAGPCKKAMIEFLESNQAESGEAAGDDTAAKVEIATAIMAATTDDELVAVVEANNELFTEFNPGDVTKLDEMKQLIVAHLGVELDAPPKKESLKDRMKKKKEAEAAVTSGAEAMAIDFNPNAGQFDPEGIYELADGLGIGQLKKFYSQLAKITNAEMASNKPGITKDALMEGIANALTDLAENGPKAGTCECPAEGAGEIEVTRKLVEDAAKAEDKESLVAMCEKVGIALNALEKRNVARMKDKLIEKLPEDKASPGKSKLALLKSKGAAAPKEEPASEIAETSKLVEIFTIVEKMVLEESEEKDIIAAVTPLYKEMGKSALAIRGRVKVLIEVVQVDHNLKK